MSTLIEIAGYGGIVPAGVAIAIFLLCRRFLPEGARDRYAAAAAVAIAFLVGYALMPWTQWTPKRHWQWLPYAGAVAMVAGPVALASGLVVAERWLLRLLLAAGTAWLLVPTWSTLSPPRPALLAMLTAYLFIVMTGLVSLPDRLMTRLFLVHLAIAAAGVALLLAVEVSLTFGQLAGIVTAAIAGCCVGSLFGTSPIVSRGLIPIFVVLIGGLAFVGCIESQPPRFAMLLAPAAPMVLWVCNWGPIARMSGKKAIAAQTGVVLAALALALACAMLLSQASEAV
jgi:hypothetical protein